MTNKFALVTGGAKRIGAILCEALVLRNYNLIIHYNKSYDDAIELKKKLYRINPSVKIFLFQADLTNIPELENLISFVEKNCGFLNVLINNASIFKMSDLSSINTNEIDKYIRIHSTTIVALSKFVLDDKKNLTERKTIINMLDARRNNDIENIQNYGQYFMYSLSKHMSYLVHQYLCKEIEDKKLSCRIFGIELGLILPNNFDDEYFIKNDVSGNKANYKIDKIHDFLNAILSDEEVKNCKIKI
jgi:NAD(P)-dependent dehydrogenase (short-subunit alcohol dehydrogenase family)